MLYQAVLLLLVDSHSCHFHPISIRFACDHLVIFCLPADITHKVQPLDASFFGPLKQNLGNTYYDFIQSSPG